MTERALNASGRTTSATDVMGQAMRRAPRRRRRTRGLLGAIGAHLLLTAIAGLMLFPFAWMVATSLTPDAQLFLTPPVLIPSPLQPENYGRIADVFPLGRLVLNSMVVALVSTVFQVVTSAMGAYAFARLHFRGRDALFLVYLATLMVPLQVTIVPLFIEIRYAGLVNTYPGLILPGIASAFGTFLLRQAFMALPREYEEAAFIDGASHWTVFRRVVLPLSKPALATFGIFAFMASWNSFLWPLIVTSSDDLMTLPVGLSNLHGRYETAWNLVMAGATVSVIPILIVYVIAQRHVIRGVALAGLKG
jgi:multiple sugar transport system permease protein